MGKADGGFLAGTHGCNSFHLIGKASIFSHGGTDAMDVL